MIEKWKPIRGYEGLYEISNFGHVKSLKRVIGYKYKGKRVWKERLLSICPNGSGYLVVALYKNGKRKMFSVHRLVADAFVPNPNHYDIVNHKDENPLNPHADNLEWCDFSYNNSYGTKIDRQKQHLDYKKLNKQAIAVTSKRVCQLSLDGELMRIWNSQAEAEKYGFSSKQISACCVGKHLTHKGYKWKLVR